jgi:hypothetical protein
MKLGLLKLLGDAELNQAKIEKLHAEAESLQREGNHNEHAARLNEINTMIALARERREATLGSVETMMKVFQSIKPPDSPPSPVTAPPAPQPGDPV